MFSVDPWEKKTFNSSYMFTISHNYDFIINIYWLILGVSFPENLFKSHVVFGDMAFYPSSRSAGELMCIWTSLQMCLKVQSGGGAEKVSQPKRGGRCEANQRGKSTDCIIRRSRKRASKPCRENRPGLVLCWFHSVARESKSKEAVQPRVWSLCAVSSVRWRESPASRADVCFQQS